MPGAATQSGDRLIWLAAAVIGCMGAGWLIIDAPWSAGDDPLLAMPAATPGPEVTLTAAGANSSASMSAVTGNDPLNLASLALAAGMLVDPPDYNAWTLFGQTLAEDPTNRDALAGLEQVADALLGRSMTAFDQGRYEDAAALTAIIGSRLPDHAGAAELSARIAVAIAPEPAEREADPEFALATDEPEAAPAPATPAPVDDLVALDAEFRAAMAANDMLTPIGSSARDIVTAMSGLLPEHELTIAARQLLATEMLGRSAQAVEAMDVAAAQTWIDSARSLTDDARLIEHAEARLADFLIAAESQKLVPLSQLVQVRSQAPEYPAIALARGVEGWVEVEFVISTDGETEDIAVLDASNEAYFGDAAITAVDAWQFEPDEFMGRPIARRSFTRLAFRLD